LVAKCITLEVEGARQKNMSRKTWKGVVEKDMNDLHLKPSDAINYSK